MFLYCEQTRILQRKKAYISEVMKMLEISVGQLRSVMWRDDTNSCSVFSNPVKLVKKIERPIDPSFLLCGPQPTSRIFIVSFFQARIALTVFLLFVTISRIL